jgi:hypothetical protein
VQEPLSFADPDTRAGNQGPQTVELPVSHQAAVALAKDCPFGAGGACAFGDAVLSWGLTPAHGLNEPKAEQKGRD